MCTSANAHTMPCTKGYTGGGVVECSTNGTFTTVSCTANACAATSVAHSDRSALGSITGSTASKTYVTCDPGWARHVFCVMTEKP